MLPRSRHSNIKLSEPLPLRGRARRGLGALPLGGATLAHKQWPFALFAGPLAGPLLGDWRPFAGIPPSLLGSENPFPAASCRQQVTGSNLHCNHHCAVTVIIISGTQAQWVGCERCPGIWNVHSPHPGGDAAQSARRRVLAPNQRIASTGCWIEAEPGVWLFRWCRQRASACQRVSHPEPSSKHLPPTPPSLYRSLPPGTRWPPSICKFGRLGLK